MSESLPGPGEIRATVGALRREQPGRATYGQAEVDAALAAYSATAAKLARVITELVNAGVLDREAIGCQMRGRLRLADVETWLRSP